MVHVTRIPRLITYALRILITMLLAPALPGSLIHAQSMDGIRWISPPLGGNTLNRIVFVTPDSGWVLGDGGTILRTTDGGMRWEPIRSGTLNDLHDIIFINDQAGIIVGDNGTYLASVTGGTSWEEQDLHVFEAMNSVAFLTAEAGLMVGDFGLILKTDNGGLSWQRVQSLRSQTDITHVVIPKKGPGLIFYRDGHIAGLTRFGQLLAPKAEFDGEVMDVKLTASGKEFVALTRGGRCSYSRDGANWADFQMPELNTPGPMQYTAVAPVDSRRILLCDGGGTLRLTTDGGRSWSAAPSPVKDCRFTAIALRNDSSAIAVGTNGLIARVRLPELTITVVNNPGTLRLRKALLLDQDRAIAISDRGLLQSSSDGGRTWAMGSAALPLAVGGTGRLVESRDSVLQMTNASSCFVTSDNGASWSEVEVIPGAPANASGVNPTGEVWAAGEGYVVITRRGAGKDRLLLSPEIRKRVPPANLNGKIVDWVLPTSKPIRTFAQLSAQKLACSDGDGMIYFSVDGGSQWNMSRQSRFVPEQAVTFAEDIVMWIDASGHAMSLRFGGVPLSPTGQQILKQLTHLVDTASAPPGDVNAETLPTLLQLAPLGTIYQSPGGIVDIACGRGKVLHSTNSGRDWRVFALPTAEHLGGAQFVDAFDGWSWTRSGVVYRTRDGGSTWEIARNIPLVSSMTFSAADRWWLVTMTGSLFRSIDGGASWTTSPVGAKIPVQDICMDASGTGWLALGRRLVRLDAGGETIHEFTVNTGGTITRLGATADSAVAFALSTGQVGTLAQGDSLPLVLPRNLPSSDVMTVGGVDHHRPLVLTSQMIQYKWDPSCHCWAGTSPLPFFRPTTALYTANGTGCAVGQNGRVLVTRNGGLTWDDSPRETLVMLRSLAYTPTRDIVWAGGEDGTILVADVNFNRWLRLRVPASDPWVSLQFLPPDLLYAFSARGKVLEIRTSEVVTED
jgi:photosystem II stability/assembly factor-like uncharacterized protein